MKCPSCDAGSGVVDSRKQGSLIYRRRKCKAGHLFTTYEMRAPCDRADTKHLRALVHALDVLTLLGKADREFVIALITRLRADAASE